MVSYIVMIYCNDRVALAACRGSMVSPALPFWVASNQRQPDEKPPFQYMPLRHRLRASPSPGRPAPAHDMWNITECPDFLHHRRPPELTGKNGKCYFVGAIKFIGTDGDVWVFPRWARDRLAPERTSMTARARPADRSHRDRLHQLAGMRLCTGDFQALG